MEPRSAITLDFSSSTTAQDATDVIWRAIGMPSGDPLDWMDHFGSLAQPMRVTVIGIDDVERSRPILARYIRQYLFEISE
jgi:hypothetical protein